MVYRAHDTVDDRVVAVKILSPVMAHMPQFSARFRREAELVKELDHPHIVPVLDFGEYGGYAFMVMPYLKSGSLAELLENEGLRPERGAQLIGQVAAALDYAHQRGIVHRDIKPSNILLDEEGNALLADFGVAHIRDASYSLTGSALIGTPSYISPEQARGDPVDARSDQYSLGVLLYRLAAGEVPFAGETPIGVLFKHINEPMPLPRAVNPRVPEIVERVILKATAKDPRNRFDSVSEMNEAFQAAVAHALDPGTHPAPQVALPDLSETLILPPAAFQDRTGIPRGRWARLAGLAALLLLMLFACPVTSTGMLNVLERASDPVEGSELSLAEMNAGQLTALAGTIEALSTEVALSRGADMSAGEIQTAVARTMQAPVPDKGILTVTATADAMGGTPTEPGARTPTPSGTADGWPTATDLPVFPPGIEGTPTPPLTDTPVVLASATPSRTATATDKPPNPTGPPPPSKTATPFKTGTPSPTPTATSSPSPTRTATPSPTWTLTPSRTPTLHPTVTSQPTVTSPPTATPDLCLDLLLVDFDVFGSGVKWKLVNGGLQAVVISGIHFDWPASNEQLESIKLGGELIWSGEDESPPTVVTSGWGPGSRVVGSLSQRNVQFGFDDDVASSGYWLRITFQNGCQVTASR